MSRSTSNSGTWRVRWADRENARREQVFAAELDQWQRRDLDLRAMREAGSFTGRPGDGSLPVPLRRDERIYLTLTGVQTVEAPGVTQLPPYAAGVVPVASAAGPLPGGLRPGDVGTAVVTSRRLLFVGPGRNREWSYRNVTGLTHDPTAPLTLIQVTNRQIGSGVFLDPSVAPSFRFHLHLSMVDARGERAAFVAALDRLIGEHQYRKPVPPAAADPARAPARAAWSPLRIVAAAVAVVVLLCVGASFLPSAAAVKETPTSGHARPRTGDATVLATGRVVAAPTLSSPSAVEVPVAPTTGSATVQVPKTAPTVVVSKAQPKPKPKPKPQPVKLCGAPRNPVGYTFCGGSLIRSPDFDACTYFDCIPAFGDGHGYMIQCQDGMLSMSGGRPGSCSHHGGNRRAVYRR
jgi:hypothetical protein